MKTHRALSSTFVVFGLLLCNTATSADDENSTIKGIYGEKAKEPWRFVRKNGDIARGVVLYEAERGLYLDAQPCEGAEIYQFSKPYEKDPTGKKVTCEGRTLTEFSVRQLR